MSKYVDARRFDTDEPVRFFTASGELIEGKVYAVQYEEPIGPDPDPSLRFNFRYIIQTGVNKITESHDVEDPKTGKLKTVKSTTEEPVYQTVFDDQIRK